MNRALTEEEFASQMKKLDRDLPTPFWPLATWELLDELDDQERKKKA
jgi:hypothetical protein